MSSPARPIQAPSGYEHLLFDKFVRNFDQFQSQLAIPYDPSTDQPSSAPLQELDVKIVETSVRSIYDPLFNSTKIASEFDTKIREIVRRCQQGRSEFKPPVMEVALVGETGVGKDTIVNALLGTIGQPDVAWTSSGSTACTTALIRYRHRSAASKLQYQYGAIVAFLPCKELTAMLKEQFENFQDYHRQGANDRHGIFGETDQRKADTALRLFRTIWRCELQPQHILDKSSATFLEEAHKHAVDFIKQQKPCEPRSGEYCLRFVNNDFSSLRKDLTKFTAQGDNGNMAWLLIDHVDIFLDHPLLRWITLINLPGLNDLNQSRTLLTNKARRQADTELHIGRPERVQANEVLNEEVDLSLRHHGSDGTILVLTRIDNVQKEGLLQKMVRESKEPDTTILFMLACERWAQSERLRIRGASDCTRRELDLMNEYLTFVQREGKLEFIRRRAQESQRQMSSRVVVHGEAPKSLRVISVSPEQYLMWLMAAELPFASRPDMTVVESGIPELRRLLLSARRKNVLKWYTTLVQGDLQDRINEVEGVVGLQVPKESKVAYFDKVRKVANEQRQHLQEYLGTTAVTDLSGSVEAAGICLENNRASLNAKLAAYFQSTEILQWQTLAKVLKQHGVLSRMERKHDSLVKKPINWNSDISKIFASPLRHWEWTLNQNASDFSVNVLEHFEETIKIINEAMHDLRLEKGDHAKRAGAEWERRKEKIWKLIEELGPALIHAVGETYNRASIEQDAGSTIAQLLGNTYRQANSVPKGLGFHRRQRQAFRSSMLYASSQTVPLVTGMKNQVTREGRAALEKVLHNFTANVQQELEGYNDMLNTLKSKDIRKLDRNAAAVRENLKALLPRWKKTLGVLQEMFPKPPPCTVGKGTAPLLHNNGNG